MTDEEVALAYRAAKTQSKIYNTTEDDVQDFMLDLLSAWDKIDIKYSTTNYLMKRAGWFMLHCCEKNRRIAKRKVYDLPDILVNGRQEEDIELEELEKELSNRVKGKQKRLFYLYSIGYPIEQVCDCLGYTVPTAYRKVREVKEIVKEINGGTE